MNEQLPITLKNTAQSTWSAQSPKAPQPDAEIHYLRVSPQWELRLAATIENDLLPLKPSEIPAGGGIFRTPVAVGVIAIARHTNRDGQPTIQKSDAAPVVFALESSTDDVSLPAMPEGLELNGSQQQAFTGQLRDQIARWQLQGWGQLEDIHIDATVRYWPDQGYVRYLVQATQMPQASLAATIGVSERTLQSWQDPRDQRSIPYAAQHLLEVIARKALQQRDCFHA
ncbi:hypothetical protein IT774_05955 [Salinimonas marina]|uniref:Uncharacterized protein n=1 Tax=Salinimonas marina TaxID=2785918 RepID=A0A7S9HEH7_9ALTE|nr:hypothetical protein [Salinimonas marina]QPG06691.1 hypothetical protein IT774_05955 [Salinimonas marina]